MPGWVAAPAELHSLKATTELPEAAISGYALGGLVSQEVADLLLAGRGDVHATRLTIFDVPQLALCLVLTVQIGAVQVRFVASVADPHVRQWLEGVVAERYVRLVFEVDGAVEVVYLHGALVGLDPTRLHQLAPQPRPTFDNEMQALGVIVQAATEDEFVPSLLYGETLKHVIVLPVLTNAAHSSGGAKERGQETLH